MKAIFEYSNFREFLTDYYHFKKSTVKGFSHRYFLEKAGLKGPNFLKNVMDGKKNLSSGSIQKFITALGLAPEEADYFEYLVLFNQAKTAAKKQKYFKHLAQFQEKSPVQQIQQDQYAYFSKWYNVVIREYIHCHSFKGDFDKLAKALCPKISEKQAEEAVQLLLKLDLIYISPDGTYSLTNPIISTGPDVANIGARQYHLNMMEIGRKSLDKFSHKKRYLRGMTGSFSEKTFEEIKMVLDNASKSILNLIQNDEGKKKVYQLNIQLFPMLNEPRKKWAKT